MTPEIVSLVQVFLDAYVLGATDDAKAVFSPALGPGIRHRFPALVGIPPEYEPKPNGLDGTLFQKGDGPEAFDEPQALYLDRCPLERALATANGSDLHIDFFFAVRFQPGQFEGMNAVVCLPSGDELSEIASECLNQLQDFLGTDAGPVGADPEFFPLITSAVQALTFDDFLRLELPDVGPR
jgi:hypothetical protein